MSSALLDQHSSAALSSHPDDACLGTAAALFTHVYTAGRFGLGGRTEVTRPARATDYAECHQNLKRTSRHLSADLPAYIFGHVAVWQVGVNLRPIRPSHIESGDSYETCGSPDTCFRVTVGR